MKTKELILREVRREGFVRTRDLVRRLHITRQTLAQHFRELIAERKLVKIGSTRNARYIPYSRAKVKPSKSARHFFSRYTLKSLDEDRVFQEADLRMGLQKRLSRQAYRIAGYAFSEMLNNAIDHSKARYGEVHIVCDDIYFRFDVSDRGIGAFESVRKKFRLKNHFEAAEHLLKGKQTTFPERHSGQGIFFTSKIADRFSLESSRLSLIVDNQIEDVILKDVKDFRGTKVTFVLKRRSRKDLKKLFDEYSDSNYEFDKTKITLHLSEKESENISRSQGRRVLFGLEKFKRIMIDFKKVEGIGQGFADEIFRVFKSMHPDIKIEAVNTSPSVEFMIKRTGVTV